MLLLHDINLHVFPKEEAKSTTAKETAGLKCAETHIFVKAATIYKEYT